MLPASPPLAQPQELVLVGGGHCHALVLRMWGMRPVTGVRLTLINPGPTAPYSGMLPGFVAGHYSRADLDIDLVRLARSCGARLILGAASGLDPLTKQITVPGQPPVAYDVASIDIGISSDLPELPGFETHAVAAKPLGPFATGWAAFRDQHRAPAPIAVIGGGIAGVELILAMTYALRRRGRLCAATLIDRGEALASVSRQSRARLQTALRAAGVSVIEHTAVAQIAADYLLLCDGRRVASSFTVGAAGARPYAWLQTAGLRLHNGAIEVSETLQSSDPDVFASGDCAHMRHAPRPKAGVFAVRQAPVLMHNLRHALTVDRAEPLRIRRDFPSAGRMRAYWPQKDYLKLISLGGKSALADRPPFCLTGPLLWRWKDHIDRRFMAHFSERAMRHPQDASAD